MRQHILIAKIYLKKPVSNIIFKNKAYETSVNSKYYEYQRRLASMVYKFLDKKTGLGARVNQ